MKVLVVWYSRHGHTRLIGKEISKALKADFEEIVDLKSRTDVVSWAESAFNSQIRKPTKIRTPKRNPGDYDLVVIGTPIWDGVVPAVKAYLKQFEFGKNVAFFSTFGASAEDAFEVMSKLSKRKAIATLGLQDRQIILSEHKDKIKKFCESIKKGVE